MNTEVVWSGPCDMSGYGIACIGYATGLTRYGLRVRLVDKSQSIGLAGKGLDAASLETLRRLQEVEVSKTAPYVSQQVPERFSRVKIASRNIGYTIFEMTSIPKTWLGHCKVVDELWTGSQYSKDSFVASGYDEQKIHVVPHIIDTDKFSPAVAPLVLPDKTRCNFVSVFDFQARKAWRELITAYVRTFKANDDVCLWLKCFRHGFRKEDQIALITQLYKFMAELGVANPPKIQVCPFDLPLAMMPSFYTSFDCYVSISREGFGLPYAEAAACGLAVIGPEKSGTRQFLNEENSYIVKYTGDTVINQEMLTINPSFAGLKWASHSVEHLGEQMRRVYENPSEARAKGLKACETIRTTLHYSVVGEQIKTLLER